MATDPDPTSSARPRRRRLTTRVAAAIRWLHIYVSMFGLVAVLFFSVTGMTLNHPEWTFGLSPRETTAAGEIDKAWLGVAVDKLRIVEHLRAKHRLHGAAECEVDEFECAVRFRGAGYSADAFINRATGRYQLTAISQGLVAALNDLHKGRDTGRAWAWVIDVSAVLLAAVSLTGLILLFTLKLRRVAGLIVGIIGALVLVVVVIIGVP